MKKLVRKEMPKKLKHQLKQSRRRKGRVYYQYKMDALKSQSRTVLAETKRQIYRIQSQLDVPYMLIPFDSRFPAVMASLYIKCPIDYCCDNCFERNKCYVKAVAVIQNRARRFNKYLVNEYELFHENVRLKESDKSVMDYLRAIFKSWGE